MKKLIAITAICAAITVVPTLADASVIFTFQEGGGGVTMTSSGTLDTTKLVASGLPDGWGGTGIEDNAAGDIDIMGGTSFGAIDRLFGFNPGTDVSDITNPGGPFTFDYFAPTSISGSKSFSTYSGHLLGLRQAGIGMRAVNMVGGLWTPDQTWGFAGQSFASMGLNPGTFTVADSLTGESITIQVGAVPEPSSLLLLGTGIAGMVAKLRNRRKP